MPPTHKDIAAHFWSRVKKSRSCWVWTGCRSKDGYGTITYKKTGHRTHRMALTLSGTTIPDGMIVMHKCDNPACVRPSHLKIGTQKENMSDASIKGRIVSANANKTLCKYGHPFSEPNTYVRPSGVRVCRTCAKRMNSATSLRRKRERAEARSIKGVST